MYYMVTCTGSNALTAINSIVPLDLDRKNYLPKHLKKSKSFQGDNSIQHFYVTGNGETPVATRGSAVIVHSNC